jgi:proteasome assembly chaperone (PAC2) family protein
MAERALIWDVPEPGPLRDPVFVCAFRGWNDAANSASMALVATATALGATQVAHVDPEEFFDFQANRPTIHLQEGQTREVEWPSNRLMVATTDNSVRDLILFDGTEPNLRWRTFTEEIAQAAGRMGARMIVSLGALIADVPHSVSVPITGIASDSDLVERLGLERSNYEGPTGVVGVLHDTCRRLGMTSASLWAAVPHYVAVIPNPKAALALVRRLEGLTGVAVDAGGLEEASDRYSEQVDRAVAADPDIQELVNNLEQQHPEEQTGEDLPSGDSIARDFQRYLRQQGD